MVSALKFVSSVRSRIYFYKYNINIVFFIPAVTPLSVFYILDSNIQRNTFTIDLVKHI